jgi:hypothetical protein
MSRQDECCTRILYGEPGLKHEIAIVNLVPRHLTGVLQGHPIIQPFWHCFLPEAPERILQLVKKGGYSLVREQNFKSARSLQFIISDIGNR